MDTDSFYLAWGKSQQDDSAIAGLWVTAHFLIHPSFMKWGIGEALFNNEINSSSRDSWSVSFWRWHPQTARTPHCYIHCFWIFFFLCVYEEQALMKFMKSKQCVIHTDFYYLERNHREYSEWHIRCHFWNSKMRCAYCAFCVCLEYLHLPQTQFYWNAAAKLFCVHKDFKEVRIGL